MAENEVIKWDDVVEVDFLAQGELLIEASGVALVPASFLDEDKRAWAFVLTHDVSESRLSS